MNYTKLNNEIFEDEELKHTEFRVLVFLIKNYNYNKGYSFPTRKQISEYCKINKDTLGNVLNTLENKGYITRKNNPFKSGRNTIYIIHKYLCIDTEESIRSSKENKTKETFKQNKTKNKQTKTDIVMDDEKLMDGYKTGKIKSEEIPSQDLKQKIETVESVIGKSINPGFINILSKLSWEDIIEIDKTLIGKTVNESYYLGAIYRKRPDLKCEI